MSAVTIRSTDDFREIYWILTELGERLPQLRGDQSYYDSIPHYLSSGGYKFFIAGPHSAGREIEQATAFGFVTFYRAPMQERIVLAVESFWFAEDDIESQLPIWRAITSLARRMEFHGVCVSELSVNTPNALRELILREELDGDPVGRENILLQAEVEGIYSAFSSAPLPHGAFLAPCFRIYTLRIPINFSGCPTEKDAVFYRGEGRLVNLPHWHCQNLDDLRRWFMRHGFAAREEGQFRGTVQEQILQQGYVNQPTVSLTKSFDVAAYYATNGNRRKQGLVFTIDGERLSQYGDTYDSFATMARHCDWMLRGAFDALRKVVATLGVLEAGRFLARCYEQSKLRVRKYGHLPAELAPEIDWSEYISEDELDHLYRSGISEAALEGLRGEFEAFWMFALGYVGSIDTISLRNEDSEKQVDARPAEPFGYYIGFRQVEERLRAALENQTEAHRHPGWDLTAFGYMAKTCRDKEFFSTGGVPGDCIVEATLVGEGEGPGHTM